jgi:hypothetical protein
MAEVIGLVASGMTIAGLFKICVEAFDLIQTGRHQELDLKKLTLRLNIEKCRLYTWGKAMGLTNPAESSSEDRQHPLDLCEFRDLVKETLEVIFRLFNDTHKIKDTYGCITYTEQDGSQLHPSEAEEAGPVENLATSFANFKIGENKRRRCSNVMQKAKWVVCDRKKFNGLINEVKDLINALQDITKSVATAADQNLMMRKGISDIRNVETLELVAEVCEVDYQDLSDAASMRAETGSMATTVRNGIAAWTDSVDAGNAIDVESEDLESLTITELKHRLLQLLEERRAAPAAQASVAPLSPNSHIIAHQQEAAPAPSAIMMREVLSLDDVRSQILPSTLVFLSNDRALQRPPQDVSARVYGAEFILNQPLPDQFYSITHDRSNPIATQHSTLHHASSQYPFQEPARGHITSSQHRIAPLSPTNEGSER